MDSRQSSPGFDQGLLSPVTVNSDRASGLSDSHFFAALIETEVALSRAWGAVGVAPEAAVLEINETFKNENAFKNKSTDESVFERVLQASVSGGNPVISLVQEMRASLSKDTAVWLHRGATSQDIFDTSFMLTLKRSGDALLLVLNVVLQNLTIFANEHRETVCAARTLTQHAVPTTIGLRAALWAAAITRARKNLLAILAELPAQLGGAAGTQAALVQLAGAEKSASLTAEFAHELGLNTAAHPWHVVRWPVTELGNALTGVLDALGVMAADIATGARTEIGEYVLKSGGGSSAMPQKNNPTPAVLIKSASLRAPGLNATLHQSAALAVDERPDGAWHAEWQTLRELMRLTHGAAATAKELTAGLSINAENVAANLSLTGPLIVSERIMATLAPFIGADRVKTLISGGADGLEESLAKEEGVAGALQEQGLTLAELLDPKQYLGRSVEFVDEILNTLDS